MRAGCRSKQQISTRSVLGRIRINPQHQNCRFVLIGASIGSSCASLAYRPSMPPVCINTTRLAPGRACATKIASPAGRHRQSRCRSFCSFIHTCKSSTMPSAPFPVYTGSSTTPVERATYARSQTELSHRSRAGLKRISRLYDELQFGIRRRRVTVADALLEPEHLRYARRHSPTVLRGLLTYLGLTSRDLNPAWISPTIASILS